MANPKVNYTAEMTATMRDVYVARQAAGESNEDILASLSETLGRSVRSVRAKLVREGVYIAPEKAKAAPRDLGPTKAEYLQVLVDNGFDVDGLEGATKSAIQRVIGLLNISESVDETVDDEQDAETIAA